MDNEALAAKRVDYYVRTGLYEPDEIIELIDEADCDPGQIDHDWLRTQIDQALQRKRSEEVTWPSVTDCDRLDRVMDSLWEQGILALQDAGYTQEDGLSDVAQFYQEAGGENSNIEGYCFYHGQDVERVMAGGNLFLAFGEISGDDEKGQKIGQKIRKAFEEAGFRVEWDGTVQRRLEVQGINWQRRMNKT